MNKEANLPSYKYLRTWKLYGAIPLTKWYFYLELRKMNNGTSLFRIKENEQDFGSIALN